MFSDNDIIDSVSSVSVSPGTISIPDTIEEGKDVYIGTDVINPSATVDEIADGILSDSAANELEVTQTIAEEWEMEIDVPIEAGMPDVDGLGLPELGAVLMTRFPFSIPFDIIKGIKLLAAPAKTPYFEVDFLAPIGHLVGGWKGSTAIVLDFSEYEIIGQVTRWASTIGFCLLLAAGTKKLIWTA